MTYKEVMKEMEALGTEQNRGIYKRHGAGEGLFGVSFADAKRIGPGKVDHGKTAYKTPGAVNCIKRARERAKGKKR